MTYRLQNMMLAMLLALTTLFVGFGTLSQNPTSGGYQLFGPVASGKSGDIQLVSLGNFAPPPETASEYANAPNRLQDLAPDQLSYQRLLDGVDELDVTTGRNQSVFYSGRGAREAAENHATSNGLTTLEQTAGGRHLDDLRLFDSTVADVGGDQAANVWGRVSSNYASQASGDVTAIVNNPRPTSIFLTQELPTLLQNSNVTQVTVRSTNGAQVSIPRGTAIDDALRMLEGF